MPRGGGSAGGVSAPVVAALCFACLCAGFFFSSLQALPAAGPAEQRPAAGRRALREAELGVFAANNTQKAATGAEPRAPKLSHVQPRTFEEAAEFSGLLKGKPAVEAGESGHSSVLVQPMQMLSLFPRTYLYPSFLDDERADHVVELAKARLAPSGLALRRGDTAENSRDVRTSQGTFISRRDDPKGVLGFVEEKLAQLTGIPSGHGEPFNVLRYELNQHYDAHYDVFDPDSYGPQVSQRIMTVLLYLSDVEEGGETVFPLEGRDGLDRMAQPGFSYRDCTIGLRYKPRKGDALMFHSLHPNGTFDKHALHGGCPVKEGTKWVATKWIRDQCMSSRNC